MAKGKAGRGGKGKKSCPKKPPARKVEERHDSDAVEEAEEAIADVPVPSPAVEPAISDIEETARATTEDTEESVPAAGDARPVSKPEVINRKRGRGIERFVWTDTMLEILIDAWRAAEFLYDRAHPNFFNMGLKAEAVTEIAKALDVPVSEVEKKMASLRTTYGRSLAPKKSGSGRSSSLPDWVSCKMQFIRVHIKGRKATISNLEGASDTEEVDVPFPKPVSPATDSSHPSPASEEPLPSTSTDVDPRELVPPEEATTDIPTAVRRLEMGTPASSGQTSSQKRKKDQSQPGGQKKGKAPEPAEVLQDMTKTVKEALATANRPRSSNALWCNFMEKELDSLQAEDQEHVRTAFEAAVAKIRRGKMSSQDFLEEVILWEKRANKPPAVTTTHGHTSAAQTTIGMGSSLLSQFPVLYGGLTTFNYTPAHQQGPMLTHDSMSSAFKGFNAFVQQTPINLSPAKDFLAM